MKSIEKLPADYSERLESVVMLSWKILKSRLLDERYHILTEAPFQHYFGHILSVIGESFCTTPDDQFVVDLEKCEKGIKDKNKFIDIVCGFRNQKTYCAIELKFKTKKQGAQDYGRIDSYLDIEALELALELETKPETTDKKYSLGFFFMITDSTAYIKPSKVGVGTICPMHEGSVIGPKLIQTDSVKCKGREGIKIRLKGSYCFTWEQSDEWYFLCLPLKK